MTIEEILGDYHSFVSKLDLRLNEAGINIKDMPLSHVAYRTTTLPEYKKLRESLKAHCKQFVETQFNGRAVSILVLKEPLRLTDNREVSVIELPAPRAVHMYPSGLEHLGVIVGPGLDAFKTKYRHVLTGEKVRPFTTPAFISFDDGTTVKFYERSLVEVIRLQGWKLAPL